MSRDAHRAQSTEDRRQFALAQPRFPSVYSRMRLAIGVVCVIALSKISLFDFVPKLNKPVRWLKGVTI